MRPALERGLGLELVPAAAVTGLGLVETGLGLGLGLGLGEEAQPNSNLATWGIDVSESFGIKPPDSTD